MSTRDLEAIVDRAAAERADRDVLSDRYRGALLGVAVGNALGLPVEGASRSSIRRHWPQGLTEIAPQERERPWDDDLAQTVVLAEALLESEELDPDRLGAGFVEWGRENGRGMGQLTGRVLAELAGGQSAFEAARLAWERSGWSNAGNGAVMRCAPVALRWRRSGSDLVRAARVSALVTHYDPRCEWSTVALDVGLACALSGRRVPRAELMGALEAVSEGRADEALEQVVEAVGAVPEGDLEELSLDDPMDTGYTLKAMQVGLWCLEHEGDLEAVVTAVVAAGGDTDTNGAVAGAAIGARAGARAIPGRWLASVAATESLEDLAGRLLEASESRAGGVGPVL